MTYSNAIHSTISNQPKATKLSNLESQATAKNEMGKARKASKKRKAVKVAKDIHQIVTDRVIAALESGVKPWACPWDRTN